MKLPEYEAIRFKEVEDPYDKVLHPILAEYQAYKDNYARNLGFDPNLDNLSMEILVEITLLLSVIVSAAEYGPLHVFKIYFNTATYDKVERDLTLTFEAQISLIGGNLGLFAGVSVISMVELVYWVARLIFAKVGEIIRRKGEDEIQDVVTEKNITNQVTKTKYQQGTRIY